MEKDIIITQVNIVLNDLCSAAERDRSHSHHLIIPPSVNKFSELFFQLFELIEKLKENELITDGDYLLLDDIKRDYINPLRIRLSDKELIAKRENNEEIKEDLCQELSNQLNTIVFNLRNHLKVLTQ